MSKLEHERALAAEQALADAGHERRWQPAGARMTDVEHRVARSRLSVLYRAGIKPALEFAQDERMAAAARADWQAQAAEDAAGGANGQGALPLPPPGLPVLRFRTSRPVSVEERRALAAVGMVPEVEGP